MESLPHCDEVDATLRKSGGFSGALDTSKICVGTKEFVASGLHFRVGLDAINVIAILQK